jgi:hypothetical protein
MTSSILKCNLFGGGFSHLSGGNKGYSVHGKIAKNIDWVFDGSGDFDFYFDESILNVKKSNSKKEKYAWLFESKLITPSLYEHVVNNLEEYVEIFKLIFTNSKEMEKIHPKIKWAPASGVWIKEPKICKKSKLISFITSNKNTTEGHKFRMQLIKSMGNKVDLYGRNINPIHSKEQGLCDYMFSVAIENGFYGGYFTEKIMDCFATGTIPIYKGDPLISDFFNPEGIINLTKGFEVTEEIYYNKIKYVEENFEIVKNYPLPEDYVYLNYFK